MNERKQWAMVLATISVFVMTAAFLSGLVRAGDLEPSAPPGSTMHTLDEIYQKLEKLVPGGSVPLAKTGQTTSYAARDDGDLQRGVAWPNPRFTDHQDGTVTDNRTGLMWTKNADMDGPKTWSEALSECESCTAGGYNDWRLPNVTELQSLIDYSRCSPVLPAGHPFSAVQSAYYWSSTTGASNIANAWGVNVDQGFVEAHGKGYYHYVWCVRGGQ
jgi:hypothetical protein